MAIEERKERERKEFRQLILYTAEKIISQEGLEKLSIRKIANRIEYSPAIIYHYFRDKEDIINQIMSANYQKIVNALQKKIVFTQTPEENLKAMAQSYIETALNMSDYYLMAQLNSSDDIRKYTACMYEGASKTNQALSILCGCISEIRRENVMTHSEIELTAQIIVSSAFGLVTKLIVENNLSSNQREMLIDHFINNTLLKIAGG